MWLVRDSLRGASARIKHPTANKLTGGPQTHVRNSLEVPSSRGGVPGGRQDVSVLGFEDLLLEEVLLV